MKGEKNLMIGRSNESLKWMFCLVTLFLFLLSADLSSGAEIDVIKMAISSRAAKWTAQENPISLLPREERRKRLGAFEDAVPEGGMVKQFSYAAAPLPSAYDWRNVSGNNFVTPVRNQGSCGSCWAFAVTAALEAKALITFNLPGTNLNLSEQIVLSCSSAGTCNGGSTTTASNFIRTTGTSA